MPRIRNYTAPSSYMELVSQFPLMPIRDDDHLRRASEVLDEVMKGEFDPQKEIYVDPGVDAYFRVLSDLIEKYEEVHIPDPKPSPPNELLAFLIESSGMTRQAVAEKAGIATSTISSLISGARKFTTGHIEKLSKFFNLPPAAFLTKSSETANNAT